jgi:hypothetical protein
LTLQSAAQRVFPFGEYGDLRLSDRCRQRPARLPSRWARLQSVENARLAPYWLSAPATRLDPCYRTPRHAVFTTRPRPKHRSTPTELSCRSPRVRSATSGHLSAPDRPTAPEDAARLPFADDPPMRFGGPPAFEDVGSDLHRSTQLRLCSAFRLSQPLDALLRPRPFRPCFVPVTLMGFGPSEVFPRR